MKTLEEKAMEWALDRYMDGWRDDVHVRTVAVESYVAGHAEALRWTACAERQPEESGHYLCIRFEGDFGCSLDWDAHNKGWNICVLDGSRENEMFPTHWMPLPPGPKKV